MHFSPSSKFAQLSPALKVLRTHVWFLVVPTVVFAGLATLFALTKTDIYTARQSLMIRDDLSGDSFKPGRFESLESLKSAQDTVLEIARRPEVIGAALKQLGPPPSLLGGSDNYPDEETIEQVQGMISLGAPNGAEFGKTEVFVLSAKAPSRDRVRAFIGVLLDELENQLRQVREDKLASMQQELEEKVRIAEAAYNESLHALEKLERELGADVITIRSMSFNEPSEGSIQETIQQLDAERRKALDDLETARQQVALMQQALTNPEKLPSTSKELFQLQPTLEPLFVGLSTAQLRKANLSGRYQPSHPEVRNAEQEARDIITQIKQEVRTTIEGLNSQISGLEAFIKRRQQAKQELVKRLESLGESRIEYDRLNTAVRNGQQLLSRATEDLVDVMAKGTVTLTRVGSPQVATTPDGLGKKVLILAAGGAGFLFGLGVVMLLAAPGGSNEADGDPARLSPLPPDREPTHTPIANPESNAPPSPPAPFVPINEPVPPLPTFPSSGSPTSPLQSLETPEAETKERTEEPFATGVEPFIAPPQPIGTIATPVASAFQQAANEMSFQLHPPAIYPDDALEQIVEDATIQKVVGPAAADAVSDLPEVENRPVTESRNEESDYDAVESFFDAISTKPQRTKGNAPATPPTEFRFSAFERSQADTVPSMEWLNQPETQEPAKPTVDGRAPIRPTRRTPVDAEIRPETAPAGGGQEAPAKPNPLEVEDRPDLGHLLADTVTPTPSNAVNDTVPMSPHDWRDPVLESEILNMQDFELDDESAESQIIDDIRALENSLASYQSPKPTTPEKPAQPHQ